MTARGSGRHEVIQGGRWIVGSYEQDQFLLDGTHVLTWQLHWVAGWSPADGEYRATVADVYGHAEVLRGRIDGDRLRVRVGGKPARKDPADLGARRTGAHLAQRAVGRRRTMVAGGGVPLLAREERRTLRRPTVGRFPRWVFGAGDEPDARFTLPTSARSWRGSARRWRSRPPVSRSWRSSCRSRAVSGPRAPWSWSGSVCSRRCWPGSGGRRSNGASGSPGPSRHPSSARCWPWASPWRRCSCWSGCSSGAPGTGARRRPRHAGRAHRPRVAAHRARCGSRGSGRAPGGRSLARTRRRGGGGVRWGPRRARLLAGGTALPGGAGVAARPGRPGGARPAGRAARRGGPRHHAHRGRRGRLRRRRASRCGPGRRKRHAPTSPGRC